MTEPSLVVVSPGLFTTVQDLGRPGHQHLGVPVGGAADRASHILANHLVGNPPSSAALEATLRGPALRALRRVAVAAVGTGGALTVEGRPAPWNTTLILEEGDLLVLGRLQGARATLAVAGGVQVPLVWGSRATHLLARMGGLDGRQLRAGDVIAAGPGHPGAPRTLEDDAVPRHLRETVLHVTEGPFWHRLSSEGRAVLLDAAYRVSPRSDRIGVCLTGPPVPLEGEVLSEGQPPGCVQVPPDGQPIVLLPERPTVGGYPKVAVVTARSLSDLARAVPGDTVRFRLLPPEDALREDRAWMAKLLDPKRILRPL